MFNNSNQLDGIVSSFLNVWKNLHCVYSKNKNSMEPTTIQLYKDMEDMYNGLIINSKTKKWRETLSVKSLNEAIFGSEPLIPT